MGGEVVVSWIITKAIVQRKEIMTKRRTTIILNPAPNQHADIPF